MLLAGLVVLKGKHSGNLAVAHYISFDFAGECAPLPLTISILFRNKAHSKAPVFMPIATESSLADPTKRQTSMETLTSNNCDRRLTRLTSSHNYRRRSDNYVGSKPKIKILLA